MNGRIEQFAPELEKIIAKPEPIQELAEGFGGPQGPAEGPLWWKEGRYLLFSDIHNNRRMKYVPGQGASVFLEPTNRANGLTRDLQGRLIACEHDSRRVTRQELDGSLTVIANSFQGRRLNRPNDVVVKSDGCIYFTDPWTSPLAPEQWDLTFAGVYRVTPDLGTMSLLVSDFVLPNGLAFTPDEQVLLPLGGPFTSDVQGLPHSRARAIRTLREAIGRRREQHAYFGLSHAFGLATATILGRDIARAYGPYPGNMPVDKVLIAAPRGFCAGVEMAIKALAWMVRRFGRPLHERLFRDYAEKLWGRPASEIDASFAATAARFVIACGSA